MATTINPTGIQSTVYHPNVYEAYQSRKAQSALSRFISWCEAQQHNRMLWLAIALMGHGGALTPITLYAVVTSGMSFALFMTAMAAMAMALVVNLAALPTKITIPVFVLSIIIDIVVVAASLSLAFQ